jgi:hypothetical protein
MIGMSVASAFSASSPDVSFRGLLRQLASILPDAAMDGNSIGGPPIEAFRSAEDLPRLVSAQLLEGGELSARRVPDGHGTPFAAFLDGKQTSQLFRHGPRGVPIIYGTVGAAVRLRRDRRMTTWAHEVARRLYAPKRLLPAPLYDALGRLGVPLVDTSAPRDEQPEMIEHPFAISDAAIHCVQADRDRAEQRLAERWCDSVAEPLFVDGGISGSDRLATADCVVGVVKNHRSLYAEGAGLDVVFGLRGGERTSVFQVTSRKRMPVASWYLRLRDRAGQDPMWGLVRVEVPYSHVDTNSLARHADDVSRRILAEVSPVALPDARWDRMVYGIRDCEEFLRSVM